MAARNNYAFYPPAGVADYCVGLIGAGVYGVFREIRSNDMPAGTPYREIYDVGHREPTGITAATYEAAVDAMWALAETEGKAVNDAPEPPHRKRHA